MFWNVNVMSFFLKIKAESPITSSFTSLHYGSTLAEIIFLTIGNHRWLVGRKHWFCFCSLPIYQYFKFLEDYGVSFGLTATSGFYLKMLMLGTWQHEAPSPGRGLRLKKIPGATSANGCRADWHFLRCLPSREDWDGAWPLAQLLSSRNLLKAHFDVQINKQCICVKEDFSLH